MTFQQMRILVKENNFKISLVPPKIKRIKKKSIKIKNKKINKIKKKPHNYSNNYLNKTALPKCLFVH